MILKTNQYRFEYNDSTVLNNIGKNFGLINFYPNFKSIYKKVYYEVYIYHRDNSRDHGCIIRLSDNNGIIFEMGQYQVNHSSSISSSESGLSLYNRDVGYRTKFYKVPRHPVYGIGYDFETGTMNIYNGSNSIIFSISSSTPIQLNNNMKLIAGRIGDGGNSNINITFYFGEDGFNFSVPEGYHPFYEVLSCAPTYEKDNEMFIG